MTDEEKDLLFLDIRLVRAIEYHESMIPELEPERDQTQFEEERAYHQDRIEWLKELLDLRNRVERQDLTIAEYEAARNEDPHRKPLKRLYRSERDLSEKLERANELLESTQRQARRLQDENRMLKEKIQALGEIIADLKLDLKARE